MANSKYEYVKGFESNDYLLPQTWIVVRLDGRGFHKIAKHYKFSRPTDVRAINLINAAAQHVLRILPDIVLGYGHSDEYSFVFKRDTTLFERRREKLVSTVCSSFTAAYVALWDRYMRVPSNEASVLQTDAAAIDPAATTDSASTMVPSIESIVLREQRDLVTARSEAPATLVNESRGASNNTNRGNSSCTNAFSDHGSLDISLLPTFDGRAVVYPSVKTLRDYLSWRQVDCHINNLYNTTFWALVQQGGMSNIDAEQSLKGSLSSDKNEILFSRFGINYNNEPALARKGSIVLRDMSGIDINDGEMSKTRLEKVRKAKNKAEVIIEHVDLIGDVFWEQRPWLLSE